jgi:hypothetical protein
MVGEGVTVEGLSDLIINGVSAVVVIYGVIEALKQAHLIKNEYAPLLSIGIGVGVSVANALYPNATGVALVGVNLGVFASMVYAGFKKRANETTDS